MKQIIIALSGRKNSGKNTAAQCIGRLYPGGYTCAFADLLKQFCIDVLGLTPEQCYGTDKDKNTQTKHGLSARQVMQYVGTDLIRKNFGNVWAEATIRKIQKFKAIVNVITDCRFPNEVNAILREPHGFVIRLTRSPFGTKDQHPSEASLDNYDWNHKRLFVLDNRDMSIEEQNKALEPILKEILCG